MRTRLGFARLLPLVALTGVAAGTIVLLARARSQPPRHPIQGVLAKSAAEVRSGASPLANGVPASRGTPVFWKGRTICLDGRVRDTLGVSGGRLDTAQVKEIAWALTRADARAFAYLEGVDLRRADLSGLHLVGTSYDRLTRWPAGFDP